MGCAGIGPGDSGVYERHGCSRIRQQRDGSGRRGARKFEVIGEALNQLSKCDAAIAARIPDLPQIVAFRNQLIHGYATVKVSTVWTIVQSALPALLKSVQVLLDELG